MGWNGNQPKETLVGTIAKVNTERENLSKRILELQSALAKAKKEVEAKDEELVAANKDYMDKLADLKKNLKTDFDKSDKDFTDFRAEVDTLSDGPQEGQGGRGEREDHAAGSAAKEG